MRIWNIDISVRMGEHHNIEVSYMPTDRLHELLSDDMEIVIYTCYKLNHKYHVVLMDDEELLNVKAMTIQYGLDEIEKYLERRNNESRN